MALVRSSAGGDSLSRRPHLTILPWVLAATCLALTAVHASTPKFFQAQTQADFLRGDVENLSIDVNGQLVLGPATELVYEAAAPFLWALLPGPDGSLFVGTGNEGKVFRVDSEGRGTPFFDSAELEVHALAPAPDGGVYVATSPDGKIYKVDKDGGATTFFDPDDKYIWSLAVDDKGNLFAGTGEKGVIYKIVGPGQGTLFYKTNATHATALALDKAGNLLAGTGSPGRVLRIDPDGKPFVLLDSPFQEIRVLRFDSKGTLFAGAINGRPAGASAAPADDRGDQPSVSSSTPVASVTVSTEITSIAVVDTSGGTTATRDDPRAVRGAVYRIDADGVWDLLWESRDDSPYDLTFDAAGRLIIGTGGRGKMYRLEGNPLRPTLLARAGAQQVTAFYKNDDGRLYYATANPGKVYRLEPERAERGTYESEPRDARMIATWGSLSWRGSAPDGSRIELFTRSGNTATPDETWSPWSGAYTNAEGSPITSPKTRYLQWRAVLTGRGDGPVLTSVTAAYLQRNLRPQVRSLTVHPPGIVFQKPYTNGEPDLAGFDAQTTPERTLAAAAAAQQGGVNALGRRDYQKGLETLQWRADDENEDELVYDILYRREGENDWKPLRRGVSDTILVWDTSTVPNGSYFVKIVASDGPSNPPDMTLTGELESTAFDVDNTAPAIAVTAVRAERGRTVVTFDVTDDHSPIQRVEFSEDGQRWRAVFPKDGIADSRQEHYELAVDGVMSPRGLTLRVADSMNNVDTGHVDPPSASR